MHLQAQRHTNIAIRCRHPTNGEKAVINNDVVYKVCPSAEWATAVAAGRYDGSADDRRDGFVHLSKRDQLRGTLQRHFRGADNLVLIAIPAEALGPALRWEASRGGDLFPHLYGTLDPKLARSVLPLTLADDGVPILPDHF